MIRSENNKDYVNKEKGDFCSMKRFIIMGMIIAICLAGCGATDGATETGEEEAAVQETATGEAEAETLADAEEETEEEAEDEEDDEKKVKAIDSGIVINYVDESSDEVGFYYWVKVYNGYEDKYLKGITYNVTISNKAGEVVDSDDMSIGILAAGETAITAAYFETSIDFLKNDVGDIQAIPISGDTESMDEFDRFRQADLEFSNMTVYEDLIYNGFRMTILNTNEDTAEESMATAKVLMKKDGEVVGYMEEYVPYTITPNVPITAEFYVSSRIPTDCDDYDVFVDFWGFL